MSKFSIRGRNIVINSRSKQSLYESEEESIQSDTEGFKSDTCETTSYETESMSDTDDSDGEKQAEKLQKRLQKIETAQMHNNAIRNLFGKAVAKKKKGTRSFKK